MTQIHEHRLEGCAPVPLAGYLKALGIFRVVAEQADPDATGCWRGERFTLRTKLNLKEMLAFFATDYQPSPILSPWNGRAGFLEGEGEGGEESSREGAKLVRAYETAADRFSAIRTAALAYKTVPAISLLNVSRARAKPIQEKKRKKQLVTAEEQGELSRLEKQIEAAKRETISQLRSAAPDISLTWFDACMRLAGDNKRPPMAPLLGAGGADGSRDFGMGFGLALKSLFALDSGAALPGCEDQLRAAMFADPTCALKADNVGLFEPAAVGENQTSGFRGEWPLNNWDFVLLLEGAVLFGGSATRRLGGARATRASFPFTVDALTAGSGATAPSDDKGFGEFWAPLWDRFTPFPELAGFMREGRSTLGRKTVTSGLDFAVAAATLGADRGVRYFQRYALLVREPQNPRKATALARVATTHRPTAAMAAQIQPWLARLKTAIGDGQAGAALVIRLRRAEDALFALTAATETHALSNSVQATLVNFGALAVEVARRPGLMRPDKGIVPPPPMLGPEWALHADDGSPEIQLATALAGLLGTTASGEALPFRAHVAPLSVGARLDQWGEGTETNSRVVWTGRDLVRDAAAVLERRLVEAQRREFVGGNGRPELPLASGSAAPLSAVIAFLDGTTDDDRVAGLTAGLAWVSGSGQANRPPQVQDRARRDGHEDAPPFLYALIKPLFEPKGAGPDIEGRRLVQPLPLLRLLQAGQVQTAARRAQQMARGAGLPAPFLRLTLSDRSHARRLAAALVFPIFEWRKLTDRAYPDLSKENLAHAG